MNKCLQCEREYKAKRPTSKFCSDNCRVKYHRDHKEEKKDGIGKVELEVLYNKILDLVGKIEKSPSVDSVDKEAGFFMPEPKTKRVIIRTFEQWVILKRECETEEDWLVLAEEIRNASNLSIKQKQLLLN